MNSREDIKILISFLLITNIIGALVYLAKTNVVGIFNCTAWAVISGYILFNFKNVFIQKN